MSSAKRIALEKRWHAAGGHMHDSECGELFDAWRTVARHEQGKWLALALERLEEHVIAAEKQAEAESLAEEEHGRRLEQDCSDLAESLLSDPDFITAGIGQDGIIACFRKAKEPFIFKGRLVTTVRSSMPVAEGGKRKRGKR